MHSTVPECQLTVPWLKGVWRVAGVGFEVAYLLFCSAWNWFVLAYLDAEAALLMNLPLQFFRPHDAPQWASLSPDLLQIVPVATHAITGREVSEGSGSAHISAFDRMIFPQMQDSCSMR